MTDDELTASDLLVALWPAVRRDSPEIWPPERVLTHERAVMDLDASGREFYRRGITSMWRAIWGAEASLLREASLVRGTR